MKAEGGCYCGAVRYAVDGEPMLKAQCHCRECQYITGGAPNMFMVMPQAAFRYTKGEPKQFTRSDLATPVTREFCPNCGTHLATRPPRPVVVVKIGTLDDPKVYGAPSLAIFTIDKQPFHQIPDGIPTFERRPG
ncbi:MAG: GFA family protein [Reyranellaceae bacterium]